MQISRVFFLILVVAGSVTAAGSPVTDTPVPEAEVADILGQPGLILTDLFRLAELGSPQLAAARAGVQAHEGWRRQAGSYPNPRLGFSVEELPVDEPSLRKEKVELSQALVLGGRRGAAMDRAGAEYRAAAHLADQERRNILREVHRLWIELMHLRAAEAALADLHAVAAASRDIARTRFESRAAPEAHLTRAMLEVFDLEMMRQQNDEKQMRALAELRSVLGGVLLTTEQLVGKLEPEFEAVGATTDIELKLAAHPLLLAAEQEQAAAAAGVRAAKAVRVPDLEFFVAYGRFGVGGENFVEGGVSFPLPIFDGNGGEVAASRSLATRADYTAHRMASELAVAFATAQARHDMANTQLDRIIADITPAAARGLTVAQDAYRVGRIMFLELIDAQRTHADVVLRGHELRKNLALAEADMMRLLGEGPYQEPGVKR